MRTNHGLTLLAPLILLVFTGPALGADCNDNGIGDKKETKITFTQLPSTSSNSTPVLADIDGNGTPDIVLPGLWYANDGAGTFTFGGGFNELPGPNIEAFPLDFDGDGDTDVWLRSHPYIELYENDGQGNLEYNFSFIGDEFDHYNWTDIDSGDRDNDGDEELLISRSFHDFDSSFESWLVHGVVSKTCCNQFAGDGTVSLGDFDGDQDLDVVLVGDVDSSLEWYRNDGGTYSLVQVIQAGVFLPFLDTADMDGDGDVDIIGSGIRVYENLDGQGTFGPAITIATASTSNLVASDVNGDGRLDIVAASTADDSLVWYANPGELDGSWAGNPVPVVEPFSFTKTEAGDVNGDFVIDLLLPGYWFRNDSGDCNGDRVPDECGADCNGNGVPDECDIHIGAEFDCNGNGIPYSCEFPGPFPDCNANEIPDACEDCNGNGVADECDISQGTPDCTANGVPDECEPDCNGNDVADSCDIDAGTSADCDLNGVPDSCDPDCNGNSTPDACDIESGTSPDCDDNDVPDECDPDCNANGDPDACDVDSGASPDCNGNGEPDECDVDSGASVDCDANGVPDECLTTDCNANGVPDACDVTAGTSSDCDQNGEPDECDVAVAFDASLVHTGATEYRFVVADVDGDGIDDAVWSEKQQGVIAWQASGVAAPVEITDAGDGVPWDVALDDIDGDSDLDVIAALLVVPGQAELVWYENLTGAGVFGSRQTLHTETFFYSVGAADVDDDGDVDIVATYNDSARRLAWYENLDGAGTFGPDQVISSPPSSFGGIHAADLNGNGLTDLLATQTNLNQLKLHLNLGGGVFAPEQTLVSGLNTTARVTTVDLDGDHDRDILVCGSPDECVQLHNVGGAGVFPLAQPLTGVAAESVSPGDLDGDGAPDVLASGLWLRNLGGQFGAPRPLVGDHPAAGDFDADGDMDYVAGTPEGVSRFLNSGNDCDGNGSPDSCDPDCNGNGIADACDVRHGRSIDCDGNGIPDECDDTCTGSCDADGDLCLDGVDSDPGDPFTCGDAEGDGCDDCSSGSYDPFADGANSDTDGICDLLDCDDANGDAWGLPGASSGLLFVNADSFEWQAPTVTGGSDVRYDVLRSEDPAELGAAACVVTDLVFPREATDATTPLPGGGLYYLVRVENGCAGSGAMGQDSTGVPRSGPSCP